MSELSITIGESESTLVEEALKNNTGEITSDSTLVLVPDVHYPYHPSTGLVTNPEIVTCLIEYLGKSIPNPEIRIAISGSSDFDPELTLEYLGYQQLNTNIEYSYISIESISYNSEDESLQAPQISDDIYILNVPTVSTVTDRQGTASENLFSIVNSRTEKHQISQLKSLGRISNCLTLIDGTYCFTGRPSKGQFLIISSDLRQADAALSIIFDVVNGKETYLLQDEIENLISNSTRDNLVGIGEMLPDDDFGNQSPSELMELGYRMYSKLTGDGIPPQFLK